MGLFQVSIQPRFFLILVLIIVTLGTGMATGFELFYRLLYILGLIVAVGFFWSWIDIRALNVQVARRTLQAQVRDSIEESFTAINHSISPKNLLEVQDTSNLPGYSSGVAVSIRSKGSTSWDTSFTVRKRGIYTIGPIRVSVSDPFSIFRRERFFGNSDQLTVLPKTHDIQEFAMPVSELSGDSAARKRTHAVAPHASSIRDYASGDSLSRVHWRSTARLGKLMSKVFDLGRASEAWIMVDLEKSVQSGELEESTDEYCVSIAASLSKRYLESGMPTGFIAYGSERYFLSAETGNAHLNRTMRQMALSDSEGMVPLHVAIAREEPLWGHQSSLLVITPSPSEDWIVALRELSRQGVTVTVVIVDGRSFGGDLNTLDTLKLLYEAGLPFYVVKKGDDISLALSHRNEDPSTQFHQNPERIEMKA